MRRLAVCVLTIGVFVGSTNLLFADLYAPGNLLVARFPAFQSVSGAHTIWSDGITMGLLYPNPDFTLISHFVTPSEVSRTFSWSDSTPEFAPIVARMTDGQNQNINFYQTGGWGGNAESAWLTGIWGSSLSTNGVDLQGFNISRIDIRVDFLRLTTPGRDLFGDGIWTDVDMSGEFLIYGSAVPEPTTFTLLGLGSLALVVARRGRQVST